MLRILIFCLLLISISFSTQQRVITLEIKGAISPATAMYLKDGFKEVKSKQATLLYISLDTPGGLATSMREMIQDILNSPVPVITYVSPQGARAASAGTFLIYASHITGMAEGTNIGAATPVNLMQAPNEQNKKDPKSESGQKDPLASTKSALQQKVLNDSVAYIKSLAELRGRNIEWGILAVKEGASISAKEALEINVIDYIANSKESLLKMLHNQSVQVKEEVIILKTDQLEEVPFLTSWKTKLLMVISNPNIAYVFLIVAMYGILFEMMNPGSIFPGVLGATSALIAMYVLNILPFNIVGLLLMLLGIAFIIGEFFMAGLGIMGIAGVIAFALGSVMLFDEEVIGVGISYPLIAGFTIFTLLFFLYVVRIFVRSRKASSVVGVHNLVGQKAYVTDANEFEGTIEVNGELWHARSQDRLDEGMQVIIEKVDGLNLNVRRKL